VHRLIRNFAGAPPIVEVQPTAEVVSPGEGGDEEGGGGKKARVTSFVKGIPRLYRRDEGVETGGRGSAVDEYAGAAGNVEEEGKVPAGDGGHENKEEEEEEEEEGVAEGEGGVDSTPPRPSTPPAPALPSPRPVHLLPINGAKSEGQASPPAAASGVPVSAIGEVVDEELD
jgi:hypothetical protein